MVRILKDVCLWEFTGYDVVRIVIGLILLIAAGLKTHQLATEPVPQTSVLDSRWFLMCVVEFELLFGLWLLSGLTPQYTWAMAVLCFACFSCVSLYKAVSGEASCGCFGKIGVNPWFTLALDGGAVSALVRWRAPESDRGSSERRSWVHRGTAVAAIWLASGLPAATLILLYKPALLGDSRDMSGTSQVVMLEPAAWIGKVFPLFPYVDVAGRLRKGKWIVVLYHHDCPACEDALPRYRSAITDRAAWARSRPYLALIEMPPYAPSQASEASGRLVDLEGRLTDARDWYARTPLAVVVVDGTVRSVIADVEGVVSALRGGSA